ncbi:MAG: efflux RND transporter periplasmic adaptor subunit [Blastochloris sp.]|nr:efflux RND transporter periplasmic adaptor subunit [Blastochloris sp.]
MKTFFIILVVALVLGLGGLWGWKEWQTQKAAGLDEVALELTAMVERKSIIQTVDVAGDIEPAEQIEVKAEISAKIKLLNVKLGDVVQAGDVLVELDNRELLTDKASAEIEIVGTELSVKKARADSERDAQLFAKQLVAEKTMLDSQTTLALAENNYDKAQKRLQIVLDRLAKSKVLAPMAGRILELPVVEGQVVVAAASVNSGTSLMKIADLQKLQISTHVNQVDVAQLKLGMTVDFSVDSIPNFKMVGKIQEIAPTATVKKNIKGFTVQIGIEQPDERLRPGMTADVMITIETVENALAVPLSAVFNEKDKKVAFVNAKTPESEPMMKELEIGISNVDVVEIKSGLSEGETVLLTRPRKKEKK